MRAEIPWIPVSRVCNNTPAPALLSFLFPSFLPPSSAARYQDTRVRKTKGQCMAVIQKVTTAQNKHWNAATLNTVLWTGRLHLVFGFVLHVRIVHVPHHFYSPVSRRAANGWMRTIKKVSHLHPLSPVPRRGSTGLHHSVCSKGVCIPSF